ncbi:MULTISPECIES: hypothetical protein, partial [Serratia]|uniref:hypothetical protein n=1 Tax=Serratia TaxID=613 RepID=UPI001AEF554A
MQATPPFYHVFPGKSVATESIFINQKNKIIHLLITAGMYQIHITFSYILPVRQCTPDWQILASFPFSKLPVRQCT